MANWSLSLLLLNMAGRGEFMKNLKKIQECKRMRKRTASIISQKLRGFLKALKKFNRGESGGEEIALFFFCPWRYRSGICGESGIFFFFKGLGMFAEKFWRT